MGHEFKRRPNLVVGVFLIAYTGYAIYNFFKLFKTQLVSAVAIALVAVVFLLYFLGCRDVSYTIEKKTITTHRRLLKDKELDLMHCSIISDPVAKLTRWNSMPHAIDIFDDNNKRTTFHPKDRVNFTGAVLRENKRIHCTVKEYTDIYRKVEKRQRKERRRARQREEAQALENKES